MHTLCGTQSLNLKAICVTIRTPENQGQGEVEPKRYSGIDFLFVYKEESFALSIDPPSSVLQCLPLV